MSALTINSLPDELLELISISAGSTEYCNFRRAMKRVWLYTTGREDHCIKHFLTTKIVWGDTETTLCNKYHSLFDQPARVYCEGRKFWYQYGKLHRDNDLPAVTWLNGKKEWYQHGERHRDNDRHAIIYDDGTLEWYQYGKLHRKYGYPAVIESNGHKIWYNHGVKYTS